MITMEQPIDEPKGADLMIKSIALTLALVFGLAFSAFAADGQETTNLGGSAGTNVGTDSAQMP